jgi:hypothetical protein
MKEKFTTWTDTFVDNEGKSHHFIIVALTEIIDPRVLAFPDGNRTKLVKGVKLGWAICNPTDKFDTQLGIEIAKGRAKKNSEYALMASENGYINTNMIVAFLGQEAQFFKSNPGTKIVKYRRIK